MRKTSYFAALLLAAALTSCEKDDIGGTATESMAGQWLCTIDAVDDNGNPITQTLDGDPNDGVNYFGIDGDYGERTHILTYNTADNDPNVMWIDNMGVGNFAEEYADYYDRYGAFPSYTIKTKVNVNQNTLTFSSDESENFGDGYQWWVQQPETDADGNPVLDEDGAPVLEDVLIDVQAMPVTIEGKILLGAGRQNNGSPADSIVFFVTYKDDPWFPDDGYTRYKVSGIRYSGLAEND